MEYVVRRLRVVKDLLGSVGHGESRTVRVLDLPRCGRTRVRPDRVRGGQVDGVRRFMVAVSREKIASLNVGCADTAELLEQRPDFPGEYACAVPPSR